jgi:broad specificity phosphatase PhoE
VRVLFLRHGESAHNVHTAFEHHREESFAEAMARVRQIGEPDESLGWS